LGSGVPLLARGDLIGDDLIHEGSAIWRMVRPSGCSWWIRA
jgi:hypothetical protein